MPPQRKTQIVVVQSHAIESRSRHNRIWLINTRLCYCSSLAGCVQKSTSHCGVARWPSHAAIICLPDTDKYLGGDVVYGFDYSRMIFHLHLLDEQRHETRLVSNFLSRILIANIVLNRILDKF